MTLIECFDRTVLENIAGTLYLRPDKLIIVGDADKVSPFLPRLSHLLSSRKIDTRIELCDITDMSIRQIALALEAVVTTDDQYVIDLTGGEEPVIMAIGALLARLENTQNISVQKFRFLLPEATNCGGNLQTANGCQTYLTVEELVSLHGGGIQPLINQPAARYTVKNIDKLWSIVAEDPGAWNDRLSVLAEFEKRSESKDEIMISRSKLEAEIKNFESKEDDFLALMRQFSRKGIIEDRSSWNTIRYRYTSELYRYCTKKAGNVLEVKTLLEARSMTENGMPFFDDCAMGVSIDWDGKIHGKDTGIPDTRNEIDVILTRGMRSLFISCKNGFIGEEELYKLHTVAEYFGGPYAKKMLVATELDQKSAASNRAFAQRARDMGIILITDAAELDSAEWQEVFRSAMR